VAPQQNICAPLWAILRKNFLHLMINKSKKMKQHLSKFVILFLIIYQPIILGQVKKSTPVHQDFIITSIGEHGFYKYDNHFSYRINFEFKNNTPYKLSDVEIKFYITFCEDVKWCFANSIIDGVCQREKVILPGAVVKCIGIIYRYHNEDSYAMRNTEKEFSSTPSNLNVYFGIKAHNIDKDFDQWVCIKKDIINDWKNFQMVLGLREKTPDVKLKILSSQPEIDKQIADSLYNAQQTKY
jgi:hypothetical protein